METELIVKETEKETVKEAPAKKKPGTVLTVLLALAVIAGLTVLVVTIYFKIKFNVSISALIYTAQSPLKGTDAGFIAVGLAICIPIIVAVFAVYLFFLLYGRSRRKKVLTIVCMILAPVILIGSVTYSFFVLEIGDFIDSMTHTTTIYEDRYVDPDTVAITSDGKTKNLIYIYLESMETTYSSTEVGGRQEINYMPGMTKLAAENLSFSDKKEGMLGGFHSTERTVWTMAAILATTSGVPFGFPVERNSMSTRKEFAPGLVNLGDILAEKGYTEEFLCGSDAEFGGRKNFFTQHGNYEIFDLFTAREKGYIDPDYKVWWGYEDEILYRIAKDEITRLAAEDKPFNFTMLTVDTHHVDGYVCNLCREDYDSTTANVVSCADRQIASFVEWIKEQDFFEDTVVIISGDHPRMDTNLVEGVDYYDRTIYNCFINVDREPARGASERTFTPMDMFPTILEAIGFDVEGDRLGLGTSMFSELPTLAEEMGFESLNSEVRKYSPYYVEKFSAKKDK